MIDILFAITLTF